MKGAKKVKVTSPQGKLVTIIRGECLLIGRECDSGHHFTLHERNAAKGLDDALVAIIPDDCVIELVL